MKKINNGYPLKYALMPITKQVGWINRPGWELERDEQVVAYVAMECYLLQEVITYKENGTNSAKYLVVFAKSDHDFSTEVYPYQNIIGIKTTGQYVDYLFNSLEDAHKYEKIANDKIIEESGKYDSKDTRLIIKEEAKSRIDQYVSEASKRREKPKVKMIRI